MRRQNSFLAPLLVGLVLGSFLEALPALAAKTPAHPCAKLARLCLKAGKARKDCLVPLLEGRPVQGVAPDAAVVQACRTEREHKKVRRTHLIWPRGN